MEFLRNKVLIILFVSLFIHTNYLQAQDFKKQQEAFKKSYIHEKQGDYQEAVKLLKEIYNEDSYEINLRLGWLNYESGNFTESSANYSRALQLMPYSEEAKFGLILPKSAVGKWDEVIKLYKEILKNAPSNSVAIYKLGAIYYGRKDYQQSYDYLKKLVDLYPFNYDGLILYAWANFQLGKQREAKILFNKTLLLSPEDASALEGLSLIK